MKRLRLIAMVAVFLLGWLVIHVVRTKEADATVKGRCLEAAQTGGRARKPGRFTRSERWRELLKGSRVQLSLYLLPLRS